MTELWSDDEEEPLSEREDSPSHFVQIYAMFLFMWQALFSVSDAGMNILLVFFAKFFSLISEVTKLNTIDQLPQTVTAARRLIGNVKDNFSKYASCPKCHSVYPLHTFF